MQQDQMVGWCTLFIRIVNKEAPPSALPEDLDAREINHWWKAKKWAYANMNRLFVRYVALELVLQPNRRQIWKSWHLVEKPWTRLYRVFQVISHQLCARNPQELPGGSGKVGGKDHLAEQVLSLVYAGVFGRMCQAQNHVGSFETTHGEYPGSRHLSDPLPLG